jgi:hypothetical protein
MIDVGFFDRVLPRRFFELSPSSALSSNQLLCLVASLLASMVVERSASYFVVPSRVDFVRWSVVDAVSALPCVFLLFTTRPSSPSASEPDEEPESVGGGGAALRATPFGARFLNVTIGPSIVFVYYGGSKRLFNCGS